MAAALNGIRVIDFGQWIAGPLATMLLADQGAEVIHVNPPSGSRLATPADATLNRGKTPIQLDLKEARGRAMARRLIESADIVVENFRPGVMERLGLGATALCPVHPRLIYCSIPGFAADDPRASVQAWEGILGAATAAYVTSPTAGDGRPRFTALPISSVYGAIVAATAVAMALFARQRDGLGQQIEVPLFDATFAAIGASGLSVNGNPAGGRPDDPWGGLFTCGDGGLIRLNLATPRFVRRFLEAAALHDWIQQGYLDEGALASGTELRTRQQAAMQDIFRTRAAAEWDELGRQAGVPLTRVRTSAEWLETMPAREAGILTEIVDPEFGRMVQPGLAVRFLHPPSPQPGPRRSLVQSIEELLDRPARTSDRAGTTTAMPVTAALEGIRVLDLTQVLAGPTAGRTLAEFGADVIKINNPSEQGAGYRWNVHRYHTDVNRGKRSLLVDLKHREGIELFWQLLANTDIVMHNFRPGVAERLGIGYEQIRKRRPGIVYASVAMFGSGGAWSDVPGYEVNAQAVSGMLARTAPNGPPFAVNDYATGILAAFGLALALFARARTGEGQRVEAALARTAGVLQIPFLQLFEGKRWDEPHGPDALGWGPLQRLYRAADGWLFLGAQKRQLRLVAHVEGLEAIDGLEGFALEERIERELQTKPLAHWIERFTKAGIAVHPVASVSSLMRDSWVRDHGLSLTRRHDDGAIITTVGPAARLSGTPVHPGRPAPIPGLDAPEVLASLGMSDRLADLTKNHVMALK